MSNPAAKAMPQQELETYLAEFLLGNNMCVLATCKGDSPRATPIEYRSKGLTLYLAGEQGMKIQNIAANPNVSVGIYFPYTGMESAKGAQITGTATIITKDSENFTEALEAYQWEKTAKEFNLKAFPPLLTLIRVNPLKIELTDVSLRKRGYSPRQILQISK
jgi:nitroimidazol reductase NimA-like FMN-containing flavoprotein (pyridoxamine 5'-phosphate oxidase superfamily)